MSDKSLKLGIMKGGQLGLMLIEAMGDQPIETFVLDNDPTAPCVQVCDHFTQGDASHFDDVLAFGRQLDVLTFEFENVNIEALIQLQQEGVQVLPDPQVLALVQDKGLQKEFYRDNGFPTADFVLCDNKQSLAQHADRFPAVQKARTAGYDGRGVFKIHSADDLADALEGPCVLEAMVQFEKEIAVIVARNTDGSMKSYPVVEMMFEPRAHLLDVLTAPADLEKALVREAKDLAEAITEKMNVVGLLAVEMFVTADGKILVNEVAPRPHNSGHHTIEANVTSQYAQHLKIVQGHSLGSTDLVSPAVMINLVGEPGFTGAVKYEGIDQLKEEDGVFVHLYGKAETRPFRKMGHVTVIAKTLDDARRKAQWVKDTVRVIA